MSTAAIAPVRRRQIREADLDAVADLLTEGFPVRARDYWRNGFEILARRQNPDGYPRFGFMLERGGAPVGVVLLIFSRTDNAPAGPVKCNLSSWYVREAYRAYAPLLTAAAMGFKEVIYVNSSAADYTWSTIQTQGYAAYGKGIFVSVPSISTQGLGARVRPIGPDADAGDDPTIELLTTHARSGCLALMCETRGAAYPFVFTRWRLQSRLKMMRLLYCRDTADYVRCAGPLGRYLLRRGVGAIACDAVGPIPGLAGKYFDGAEPKFFKGPASPRLNDLAFTESVIFGV